MNKEKYGKDGYSMLLCEFVLPVVDTLWAETLTMAEVLLDLSKFV